MLLTLLGILSVASIAISMVNITLMTCKSLGMLKTDVSAEALGDKALQAQSNGVTLDKFNGNYQKYLHAIENYDLDPSKSVESNELQKKKAAAQILGGALVEHYGKGSGIESFLQRELTDQHKDFYTPQRVTAYLETFKGSGQNMEKIGEYFDNKLNDISEKRTIDVELIKAEQSLGIDETKAKDVLDAEKDSRDK